MPSLPSTISEVRERIERSGKRRLNEQNTKATLITPILRALGWNTEDYDEVQLEYRLKPKDKPVDYGLLVARTPRLFIEAKALGENLDDRRWANQIMGYASVAGVEWIVLTDGNEYRIYNTHAPVSVEEKLFRKIKITDEGAFAEDTLALLAKDRIEENAIELLWRAEFVDRQVGSALEHLFASENDMLLVNYVAGRTKNLTAAEIRASIARCKILLDFPIQPSPTGQAEGRKAKKLPTPRRKRSEGSAPARHETSVSDLIRQGLLAPPVALERKFKGTLLKARIETDGRIRFGKEIFDSPSSAAGAARATVIGLLKNGRYPATNGWDFWRVVDPGRAGRSLTEYRSDFERGGSRGATA